MSKRPAFQFYPGDWLRDSALLSCSVGARGLWIHMICLMHEGTPYGYLKVGEKVILPTNLARMSGATSAEVDGWLAELEAAGVFSRDADGCIFSRRMIRDETIRQARASGGIKGGNPALLVKGKVKGKVNLPANLQPTPSSSSSSSVQNPLPPKGGESEQEKDLLGQDAPPADTPPPLAKGPLQIRAERMFRRRVTTPLSEAEKRAFKRATPVMEATAEDDWQALEAYYAAKIPEDDDMRRRDLPQLINNWNGEIDRARAWRAKGGTSATTQTIRVGT